MRPAGFRLVIIDLQIIQRGAASQNAISLSFKQLARGLHVVSGNDWRCRRLACGDSHHQNKLMS